eukprot:CAMPEP_0172378088 /NCGR_PEP_ID=MMETSP1060-20121228/69242_1 /TAXON_ID=37318 /ORGANISM="Pseudo-nitzschia pungens, Strain cf. cingulata" /LENGTH=78 /DNA_ID=CAMNT_0013105803 /DNA_START=1349 /DNA_END=1585 /DNA_ORIENTATION=-
MASVEDYAMQFLSILLASFLHKLVGEEGVSESCMISLEVCGHGVRRDFFHQCCDGESFGRRGVAGLCEKDIGLAWYGG